MRNFVLKSGYSEVGSQFTPRHRARHLNRVDVEAAVRAGRQAIGRVLVGGNRTEGSVRAAMAL